MTSIGETLREARLRRNLGIQEISKELKIPARFLDAIEREQFDKLPGAVFAKSFVKQYARMLGLHEDEMADAVQRLLEPPPLLSERIPERAPSTPAIQVDPMLEWERVGERRAWASSLPALAMVVVVMLGCSGVYAWWQRSRHPVAAQTPASTASNTATAHDPPPAPEPAPVPQSAGRADNPAGATDAGSDTGRTASPSPASASASRSELPAAPPTTNPATATPPAPKAAAPAPTAAPGPVHVEITASELLWVFAKADGKTSFTGTLEPNQSRTIDANSTVVIRLGNAGGAHISLNGKPIGEVGPNGQPRTVQLTSGGFQIVAPPKPDLLDPLR